MNLDLESFGPGNPALSYLQNRIKDDAYRGNISSQHNRWTFDDLSAVLGSMQQHLDENGYLEIRSTDKSKRPQSIPSEIAYAKFCESVKGILKKGSQDAMRKNWFVDWHRAGWIDRFDKNLEPISPYTRAQTKFVSLTSEGKKIVDAGSKRVDRYFVFSKGIDKLYLGTINILLDLFREYRIKTIDMHEFTFFVTAIECEEEFSITRQDAYDLIQAWRSLTPLIRRSVDSYLAKEMKPDSSAVNKVAKRDFHNWINKTQQTFSLLRQTVYFEQVNHINFSHFNRLNFLGDPTPDEPLFSPRDKSRLNRSLQQKHNYFNEHGVSKKLGFELHHIVALAWAESIEEFKILDDWRNMIYLDAFSHAKITQNRNRNLILSSNQNEILSLKDFSGNAVELKAERNAIFSNSLIEKMIAYNIELITEKKFTI